MPIIMIFVYPNRARKKGNKQPETKGEIKEEKVVGHV